MIDRARRRALPILAVALICGVAGFAPNARAVGTADIEPLFFGAAGVQGFDLPDAAAIGRAPDFAAAPGAPFIPAGNESLGLPIAIAQQLGTTHQNPPSPTAGDPVIADASWTVTNDTGRSLVAPLLVFTSVDPLGSYPIALPQTGLDANLLTLLSYSFAGDDFLYGTIQLPDLAPGDSADVWVRYVVAGTLATGAIEDVLPPLGVAVLDEYEIVPEPSTAALTALGIASLSAWRRRHRCPSRS